MPLSTEPNLKKRARSGDDDLAPRGSNKSSKLELDDASRTRLLAMAVKCDDAVRKYRGRDWTSYARISGSMVHHNFGNGSEPAIKCLGCRRLTPPTLITGDHIEPKSDKAGLRTAIAFGHDGLERGDYKHFLDLNKTAHRSDLKVLAALNALHAYDDGLDTDLRNIQPLCWYCNSKKGNRRNVTLYPGNARVPMRPNEAPF